MIEFFHLLWGTILLRPYVFIFFLSYLFLAVTSMGWVRTIIFTITAYVIAFLCEYSSIHNGFPFGYYLYIPTTQTQELWIAGVPFMDSLSFTFLSYISFEFALVLRSPININKEFPNIKVSINNQNRVSWLTTFLASLLMMYLDIIIDPVALKGEKWFLGKLYYYPYGGSYFGVTIANFIGWFFVCSVIIRIFLFFEKKIKNEYVKKFNYPMQGLSAPLMYFGVLVFNITMTFLIGEKTIGWASIFITLLLIIMLVNHMEFVSIKKHKSFENLVIRKF